MSQQHNHPISPIICPNLRGRIREGEEDGDNRNKRQRSRSPRRENDNSENVANESEEIERNRMQSEDIKIECNKSQEQNADYEDEDSENEIVIPESERIPNTPSVEEYLRHQVTHYPFKAWCPICVKNAAQNNPHKKVKHMRQSEIFGMV